MTNETILKKAIEKALKNKWKVPDEVRFYPVLPKGSLWGGSPVRYKRLKELGYKKIGQVELMIDIYAIIFSHSFAKAFFGEEIRTYRDSTNTFRWQYDLQAMVLEKEPLKYIERCL